MEHVATSLHGIWRADKLQSKAAKVGFEFADIEGALQKLEEEVRELREAVKSGEGVREELGDVLFAAVKVGRFAEVDGEEALHGTCEKFISRFRAVENACTREGRSVSETPTDELIRLWNEAKHTV
jgi:tetrapyrrole methylase family protein/MazG family protein